MYRSLTKLGAAAVLLLLLFSAAHGQEQNWPEGKAPGKKGSPTDILRAGQKAKVKESLIERLSKKAFPSIIKIYGAGGIRGIPSYSTGVVVDSRGLILTAWSVSLRTDFLKVVDDNGRKYSAILHRHDPELGVALLRTKSAVKWPVMKLADSSKVKVGHSILSFGNAFNVSVGEEKASVAEGTISLIAPLDVRIGIQRRRIRGAVFLTDAPNNPGTQGGPLINLKGEFIGINGRIVESASTNTPLNFHIPTNNVRKFVAEGVKNWNEVAKAKTPSEDVTKPERVWLGLRILRFYFNRPPPTYIDEIFPDSPASKAGLEVDDLIFQINGQTVRSTEVYDKELEAMVIGKELVFTVKRGDKIVQCKLTPVKYVTPKKPANMKAPKDPKKKEEK
jgi:S1-C subfamily serine protease